MTSKRAAPSGRSRSTKAGVTTTKRGEVLEALEEKVVRMRRGLAAPGDLKLDRVGQSHPATRSKLQEIEARALERSGRLDALRTDAGIEGQSADRRTKAKIINRLKSTATPAAAAAKKPAARSAAPKSKKR